jgi:hypothetical protein
MTNRESTSIKVATLCEPDTRNDESKKLYYFDVDEYGTITDSDFRKPAINSDIFDNVSIARLTTSKNIISEIEFCNSLVEHFRWLARDERKKLTRRMELKDYRDDREHERMKRLAKQLEDEDWGWKEWIKTEGDEGSPRFKKMIVDWLGAPIKWTEDMPDNATAVGSAKRFFEYEDDATLDELDISIVEGDSPVSTYYAAELNKPVEEANKIAQKLGLSYRFRQNREGAA